MASGARKTVMFMATVLLGMAFVLQSGAMARNGGGVLSDGGDSGGGEAGAAVMIRRGRSLQESPPALSTTTRQSGLFSLDSCGARGDGEGDDTQALAKAWSAACASPRPAVVLVPAGRRYLLQQVTLSGPCKSSITLMVKGTLVASPDMSKWSDSNRRYWIVVRGVDGLAVGGGGTIDGNGEVWWKNSCKINSALPCKGAPTALSFHTCNNLRVDGLKMVNSQQIHMSVEDCTGVQLAHLSINAPGTSPNTDGIHVTRSKSVQVSDCTIKTGDDCMSIEDGTHDLHATRLVCGPGHGISIGSLGDGNSRAEVSGIFIDTVQLYGTTNGARIKTWQGGSGYAKDIIFQNMIMNNVKNPIIIDQNYCDSAKPCKAQGSAVEVSNVVFKNIKGTTTSQIAINLNCSKSSPCYDIALQDIYLKIVGDSSSTGSTCQNAKWRKSGIVIPQPCTGTN
uniref:endo-polygalacturonase n=1 Tax=Oryza brachyantha TaxID=4533 RepID=J3LTZ1_ORYBR